MRDMERERGWETEREGEIEDREGVSGGIRWYKQEGGNSKLSEGNGAMEQQEREKEGERERDRREREVEGQVRYIQVYLDRTQSARQKR